MSQKIIPETPWTGKSRWSMEPISLLVLMIGLVLFGIGESCLVLADLGSAPWMVLSQGLSRLTGINIGWMTFSISALILILWIPLRIKPGIGTILNMIIIAFVVGLLVSRFRTPEGLLTRVLLAVFGVVIIGIASALYLTSHKGPGPRDGLLVGLCYITGWRVAIVRTLLEGSVCALGWLSGGTLGLGTLAFVFGGGWAMQCSLIILEKYFPK
ncbi:membrane protein YczE [Streptococcus iniae]|uniref:membrane protein YczE n=1 Tax=Streptococcus iniae TaxID=1346 RepID=UPI001CD25629|nr:YitT family protein [Streptococcus iniae]MCA1357082.1 YitT family protein [Streptococcus iniae]